MWGIQPRSEKVSPVAHATSRTSFRFQLLQYCHPFIEWPRSELWLLVKWGCFANYGSLGVYTR
jgi:hypothetical protein